MGWTSRAPEAQFFEESRIDDEALGQIFKQIEDRVVAAQGEAIFAGLIISSLIPVLVAKGVWDETKPSG
jgi:hypothetical protein